MERSIEDIAALIIIHRSFVSPINLQVSDTSNDQRQKRLLAPTTPELWRDMEHGALTPSYELESVSKAQLLNECREGFNKIG